MLAFLLVGALLAVSAEARHRAYLDRDEKYLLEWESTDDNITFTVKVNTTGWVGLGFSPSGGMAGADIVTAWVTAEGKAALQDRMGTGKELPKMDKLQNYKLHSAKEIGGQTIVTFSRKLDTCDNDDQVITDDTVRVIYAYSDKDPTAEDPFYHGIGNRGVKSLALLGLVPKQVATNTTTYDIIPTTEIEIPSNHTSYWCSLIKFPELSSKHHMIQWEPIITKGNENFVHHMLMFGCYDGRNRSDHQAENASFACFFDANMPQLLRNCSQLISVWAVGGEETVFPPEAGYPFSNDDHPSYVIIQTHFDNPDNKVGHRDRSGFRITLTSSLRANDAGAVQVGHALAGMIIPPGQKSFQVDSFCTEPCTREVFPPQGITVFGALLHSHLLGRKMYVRHFRNDSELPSVLSDSSYDFNYQHFRAVKPIKVLPGDSLMTTCHYDSSERKAVTFGGESTTEEMCLAYLLYYPRVSLTMCESEPLWTSGDGYLYELLDVPKDYWRVASYEPIKSVNWTSKRISELQELYRTTEVRVGCLKNLGNIYKVHYMTWNATTTRFQQMPTTNSTCSLAQEQINSRGSMQRTSALAVSLFLTMFAVCLTRFYL